MSCIASCITRLCTSLCYTLLCSFSEESARKIISCEISWNFHWKFMHLSYSQMSEPQLPVPYELLILGKLKNQGCHVSGRNKIFWRSWKRQRILKKMSGNFSHFTHVRELSGNFVMSCQGIVREFYHDIFFRLKPPSHDKGSNWVVFM